MKKITLFIALIMSMSLLTPALAQTRKEKKAAKKAQWEMQQQQAKEEAELLHQIRMDSIRQAEADRQQALKEEAMREKDVEVPCDDQSYSTLTNFRALGIAENMSMQVALIYASNNARAALAEQVKASVRSLIMSNLLIRI